MGYILESIAIDFIALMAIILTSIYFYFKYKFTYWSSRAVPCLPPIVPFGNAMDQVFMNKSLGEILQDIYNELKEAGHKYGGLYVFSSPNLIIIDPELIKTVMTAEFHSFHDRVSVINEEIDPLTAHLFALRGYKWRNLRTKLSPTFTSGKMKMMFQTLLICGEQLDKTIGNFTKEDEPIDIKDILARFTTDIIASVAFGLECNSLQDPESEFRKHGKMIFDVSFLDNIRNAIFFSIPSLFHYFKIRIINPKVTEFFMNTIRQTVDYREKNKIERNDFLNLLIKLKNNEKIDEDEKEESEFKEKKITEPGITFNEMVAQAFVFFAAGFETSSSTMAFCLYELCLNSQIQDTLRKEILEVLQKYNGKFTYEAIKEMRYLDKVVKETLRKYPVVSFLNRECVKDFKIPGSDVVIEKGISIMIPALGLHRDPEYFPNPMKFDPERFSESNKGINHPYTYLPFGEGPRNCIGMRFGLMQTKVGLGVLLKNYQFTLNKRTVVPIVIDPVAGVLSAKDKIFLNIKNV